MVLWSSPGRDEEMRKGIDEIKKEITEQKKKQVKYLIISIIGSSIFGYLLGRFL